MAQCIAHIIGYVATEIEVGTSTTGVQVARFSIPLDSEKDADGKYKPTSSWAKVTVWGADKVARLLKDVKRGTNVSVYGRFKVASYISKKTSAAATSLDITANEVYSLGMFSRAGMAANNDSPDSPEPADSYQAAPRTTTGRTPQGAAEPTVF
jgi:single-stranded DNA-binding protein